MQPLIKQEFIRQRATARKIKWSRHALNELASEPASVSDVEIALRQAEVIEDYLINTDTCPTVWCWFLSLRISQCTVLLQSMYHRITF